MTFESTTLVQKCRIKKRVNIKKRAWSALVEGIVLIPLRRFHSVFSRQKQKIWDYPPPGRLHPRDACIVLWLSQKWLKKEYTNPIQSNGSFNPWLPLGCHAWGGFWSEVQLKLLTLDICVGLVLRWQLRDCWLEFKNFKCLRV